MPDHSAGGMFHSNHQRLAGFCKDTFAGRVELRVWHKQRDGSQGSLLVAATSTQGALEVGGGPWWQRWKEKAEMAEPLRSVLAAELPVDDALEQLPFPFRPPGL